MRCGQPVSLLIDSGGRLRCIGPVSYRLLCKKLYLITYLTGKSHWNSPQWPKERTVISKPNTGVSLRRESESGRVGVPSKSTEYVIGVQCRRAAKAEH